jgi:Zinc knuckle
MVPVMRPFAKGKKKAKEFTVTCYHCHQVGHMRRDCPERLNRDDGNGVGAT